MSEILENILKIHKLTIIYNQQGKPFIAVNKVNFEIKKGEIFGLVGESGSGKTTIGRSVLGLNKQALGSIEIKGKRIPDNPGHIKKISNEWLTKNVQMIFQDPTTSLNPSKRVLDIVLEGFNNYNSFAISAKVFKDERKRQLYWYRQLKTSNKKIMLQFEAKVNELVKTYEQWYRDQENALKSIEYEARDINSATSFALRGARTKHHLLIVNRNEILRKEQIEFNNKLNNLTSIKKWQKKWQHLFVKKLEALETEKKVIETEISIVETKYKEKLNDALLHLNDIQESVTYENDDNLIKIANLINFHQVTNDDNLKQLTVRKEQLDEIYTLRIRNAERLNDIKEAKKLNNLWKSEKKVLDVEIKYQMQENKKKIRQLESEGTRYKYQLIYDTRNEVYKAKQELKQIRKQERTRLIKVSSEIETLIKQLNKEKRKDYNNFIDENEKTIINNEHQKRVIAIKASFKQKIKADRKQIKILKQATLKNKSTRLKNLKLQQNNLKATKEKFKTRIEEITWELKALLKVEAKPINVSKRHKLLNKVRIQKRILKRTYHFETKEVKQELLKVKHEQQKHTRDATERHSISEQYHNDKYEQLDSLKQRYIQKIKHLVFEYVAHLETVDLYHSKKLLLNFKNKNEYSRSAIKHRSIELVYDTLQSVGLLPEHASRFPGEFSGGQKQRIGIARALIMKPELLVADEPISALDVSIQAQVINILKDLRVSHQLSILLIAHDLRMVHYVCDRIAVIKNGRILEIGTADEVFYNPVHPYTRSLTSAIPSINNVGQPIKPIIYNPLMHQYDEETKPEWHNVTSTHQVLGTIKEFKKWSTQGRRGK